MAEEQELTRSEAKALADKILEGDDQEDAAALADKILDLDGEDDD